MTLGGASQASVAKRLGLAQATFHDHYSEVVRQAIEEKHGFVVGKLYDCIKKGNVPSIIFYLKTQCGWREKDVDLSSETIEKIARGVSRSRELNLEEWQAMVDSERAKAKAKAA
jgi:predicted transcriptional regulator